MEPRENELVIILADISGYTRFMVENQLSAIHGQICISSLIEALLSEVNIPLTLQEIEGDAVFLYADHPGDEEKWEDVLAQVRTKLARFFNVFQENMATVAESTPCGCAICSNADELSLKIVVHRGTAVFHEIAGRPQVSGADVILAHRLLKNSVPGNQYLLMSDAAYRQLGAEMPLHFAPATEHYDEFGEVETHVCSMDDSMEDARTSLYSLDQQSLSSRARAYVLWASLSQIPAALEQIRRPTTKVGLLGRVGFALLLLVLVPIQLLVGVFAIPRKLLGRQLLRARNSSSG